MSTDLGLYNERKEALELAFLGSAYLDSAWRLLSSLIEDGVSRNLHFNCVIKHLAHLGIEQFYKAALLADTGTRVRGHNLVRLHAQYRRSSIEVDFSIPGFLLTQSLNQSYIISGLVPKPEDVLHQRLKYISDVKGRAFPALEESDLELIAQQLSHCGKEGAELLAAVRAKCNASV